MDLAQIGYEIRRFRRARGMTQAQLATAAGVTRTTLNQLENGVLHDLGIRKMEAILAKLNLELVPQQMTRLRGPDFIRLASTAASVSFRSALTDRELLHALLTGRVPASRRPHLRFLLEESPSALRRGLLQQLRRSTPAGKVEKNLEKIAAAVGSPESVRKWLRND